MLVNPCKAIAVVRAVGTSGEVIGSLAAAPPSFRASSPGVDSFRADNFENGVFVRPNNKHGTTI